MKPKNGGLYKGRRHTLKSYIKWKPVVKFDHSLSTHILAHPEIYCKLKPGKIYHFRVFGTSIYEVEVVEEETKVITIKRLRGRVVAKYKVQDDTLVPLMTRCSFVRPEFISVG